MSRQAHVSSGPVDSSRQIAVSTLRIHPRRTRRDSSLATLIATVVLAVSTCAISLLMPAPTAAAQAEPADSAAIDSAAIDSAAVDHEFAAALEVLGLSERWAQTTSLSPDIAHLTAGDDPASLDYLIRRSALLVVADEFASLRTTFDESADVVHTRSVAIEDLEAELASLQKRLDAIEASGEARNERREVLLWERDALVAVPDALGRARSFDRVAEIGTLLEVLDRADRLAVEVQAEVRATMWRAELRLSSQERSQSEDDTDIASIVDGSLSLKSEARTLIRELHEAQPVATVAGVDLPFVVLDAYVAASRSITTSACALDWTVLGGIGWIESHHGTWDNRVVEADGYLSQALVGIPLDGRTTALITDTDLGLYDNDRVHDRAVGPMQFIPSTWVRHGLDGNDDGRADPHNYYDAAVTAAEYLCAVVPEAGPQLRDRILRYNNSSRYVSDVMAAAAAFPDIDELINPSPER